MGERARFAVRQKQFTILPVQPANNTGEKWGVRSGVFSRDAAVNRPARVPRDRRNGGRGSARFSKLKSKCSRRKPKVLARSFPRRDKNAQRRAAVMDDKSELSHFSPAFFARPAVVLQRDGTRSRTRRRTTHAAMSARNARIFFRSRQENTLGERKNSSRTDTEKMRRFRSLPTLQKVPKD